ncbi:MAG: YdcH family protein [Erythrobacter sp.]|uniref:YdcH family protein n=1 Tax=Marinobacter alexandrii TaxID=2570351 RepID=UPI00329A78E3
MASSHVSALETKHAGLEAKLRDEMSRPVPDTSAIQSIKKRKLLLKEEISRN